MKKTNQDGLRERLINVCETCGIKYVFIAKKLDITQAQLCMFKKNKADLGFETYLYLDKLITDLERIYAKEYN